MPKGIRRSFWWNASIGIEILLIFTLVFFSFPKQANPASVPDLAIIEAVEVNKNRAAWTVLDARSKA